MTQTQVQRDRVRDEPLRARPIRSTPSGGHPSDRRGALGWIGDLLVGQGAPGSGEVVAVWRPAAAGAVVAAGGALIVVLGLVGAQLIDIVLIAGLTMLIAGFVDGTGRRYRGPGVGLTVVGIMPRLFDTVSWLRDGWAFGVFMLVYGAYIALRRWRPSEVASH